MRWAYGDSGRFAALADELIALKPDVLVGVEQPAVVMKSKTATIPIVLLASTDPVAAGLVRSLARPGTNVSGFAYQLSALITKHIEFLTEIVHKMKRVALFNYETLANDPAASATKLYVQVAKETSEAKKLALVVVSARDREGVGRAFTVIEKERTQGVVVAATAPLFHFAGEIIGQARRLRLPAICGLPGWAESGGLIGYGPNFLANYRYAATYVDRILKGAKPADMPVEQPPKFDFVVNLKVAHEIGVKIPQPILLRADRVIE
jgi:putative ABC transport system substrate-binding protein